MIEGHILERHPALRLGEHFRVRHIFDLRHHGEQSVKLLEIDSALLDLAPGPAEDVQRRIEREQHQHHGGQVADLHLAVEHIPGREDQHREQAEVHHQRLHGVQHIHAAHRVDIVDVVIAHRPVETADLARLRREGFDGLEIGQDVHRGRAEMRVGFIHFPALAHAPFGDDNRADHIQDNRRDRDQGEPVVIGDAERDGREHEPDQRGSDVECEEADQVIDRPCPALDDAVKRAGTPGLVEVQRQAEGMAERVHAGHPLGILADRGEQPVPGLRQAGGCEPEDQAVGQPERRDSKAAAGPLRHDLVDRVAHHQGRDDLQHRRGQRQHHGHRHDWPPFGQFRPPEQLKDTQDRSPQAPIRTLDPVVVFGRLCGMCM